MLLVAVFAALASWFSWLESLDNGFYDFLVSQQSLSYPDDIVLIAIDEASIARLGAWPWDRRHHAQLLQRLELADSVVFDIIFSEPQHDYESNNSSGVAPVQLVMSADQQFSQAIKKSNNVLLPVFIEPLQFRGVLREVLPLPLYSKAAAGLAHAHVDHDEDGIARGVFLREGLGQPFWPHLSFALADLLGELSSTVPGARRQLTKVSADGGESAGDSSASSSGDSRDDIESPYLIYRDYYNRIKFSGRANTLYRISYIDVLDGLVSDETWRKKRVFVGATAQGLGDEVSTPVGLMSGVEFNANAYHALRVGGMVKHINFGFHAASTFIALVIMTMLLSRLAPLPFLLATMGSVLLMAVASASLFFLANVWYSPVAFILALMLFYPLWSWRRIEMALVFLEDQLAELKAVSASHSFDENAMRSTLDTLVELGIFSQSRLVKVDKLQLEWPKFKSSGGRITTDFLSGDCRYRLEASYTGEEPAVTPILTALLAQFTGAVISPVKNAYELVEKTIGEIVSAKSAAEKSQLQMNQSMAQLQDAVLISDMAGRVIFSNAMCDTLFSAMPQDAHVFDLHHSLGSYIWGGLIRKLLSDYQPVYQELDMENERRLLCQAAIIDDENTSPVMMVFVFTDVTQLRVLERSKNEALAFLSHDMRSPIVSLLALVETYRINNKTMSDTEREFIGRLKSFAQSNLKYSEDFLQLSRAENISEHIFQLVDMHGVVDGAYAQVYGYAEHRGVNIQVVRSDEDCWVMGDAQLLERAVVNILSNAAQHTASNKIVSLMLHNELGMVCVKVTDQGTGIQADMIPHLFEPYFRVRNLRAQKKEENHHGARSYGLGLSFVHTVIKRHGGRVEVETEINKGTVFSLILPMADISD